METDMEKYLQNFSNCLQHEAPFCSSACPLGVDVNDFISRLQEGRFKAAYKKFRDAAGFPLIAAELCDGRCRRACPLSVSDSDAIELNLLEKAAIEYTGNKEPNNYNLPAKKHSIAIIGAGISGMACALRLATKRYKVTVYEKADRSGGRLWDIMDPAVFREDFELQMQFLEFDIKYGHEVKDIDEIAASGVAAIYVATGEGGRDFGIHGDDPVAVVGETGVFLGGSLLGHDMMEALGDGLAMSTAIDNFIMTKNPLYPHRRPSAVTIDEEALKPSRRVVPARGAYSKDEAVEEASRCLKCQCNSCRLHCDLIEHVNKMPLRLRDEIIATAVEGSADIKAAPAKRLISSCDFCGLCKQTCPEDIDLGGLIQAARFKMHSFKKIPWAFNDFFLRDMEHSNGEDACICRRSSNTAEGKAAPYAFFPGCQLGASSPRAVSKAYGYLLSQEPDMGLMLGCCGIPAKWAGDEDLNNSELERIRRDWESLGKPVIVLACPTCRNNFRRYLPQIETIFLYDLIAAWGLGSEEKAAIAERTSGRTFSVFDPCATDGEEKVRSSVRDILSSAGVQLEPLPRQEKWTSCCSYGGHIAVANPELAGEIKQKRIAESENPFIAYCINCRDAFLSEGKESYHLLDLMFGLQPRVDTLTRRRLNRAQLKDDLLRRYWKEAPAGSADEATGGIRLKMSAELRSKLSAEYILEEEIAEVVAFCEKSGRTVYDPQKKTYSGYRKIGHMTYWVEYARGDDENSYLVSNAYGHRMEIELEMIWNGEKADIDL
jgi:Fe-S oxidoreductase